MMTKSSYRKYMARCVLWADLQPLIAMIVASIIFVLAVKFLSVIIKGVVFFWG